MYYFAYVYVLNVLCYFCLFTVLCLLVSGIIFICMYRNVAKQHSDFLVFIIYVIRIYLLYMVYMYASEFVKEISEDFYIEKFS